MPDTFIYVSCSTVYQKIKTINRATINNLVNKEKKMTTILYCVIVIWAAWNTYLMVRIEKELRKKRETKKVRRLLG